MIDAFEDHCWQDVVSPEVLEIYQAYKRDTYIGKKPALLAIDLHNLAFEGGPRPVAEVVREFPSSCGIYAWEAIEPIKELLSLARAAGIPVIYTTRETRPEVAATNVKATNRELKRVNEHTSAIRDDFRPEPIDTVIYKLRASAFFGTPLLAHLIQRGIDSLIVCGESTSGCLRASVVDSYSFGFHTTVVEECCFDRSLLSHKISLFDMHHKYADVMHLKQVKKLLGTTRDE